MIFSCQAGLTIKVSSEVRVMFERYKQSSGKSLEAGGILLGTINLATSEVEIDELTEPAKTDKRGRFFFWRKKNPTQRRINMAWKSTGGTLIYLGEWHTHPEPTPTPSSIDLQNWKSILTKAKYEQEFLLFIIVGQEHTRIWKMDKNSQIVAECLLQPDSEKVKKEN